MVGRSRTDTREALNIFQKLLFSTTVQQNRGLINEQIWRCRREIGEADDYCSQFGQDRWLDLNIFHGKRNGVFVEIGGYDGVNGSNCLFFERHRGWSGILVEPSPRLYAKAAASRDCPCLNVAISDRTADAVAFLEITEGATQMGGLVETLSARDVAVLQGDAYTKSLTINVPTRRLEDVLHERGLATIDYISMDIEGGEAAALRDFPFRDFTITAWSIENKELDQAIFRAMTANGYRLRETLGVDELYVKD